MTDADGRTPTIERLKTLLNRLSADDLTLAEAALVRAEVFALLSESNAGAPGAESAAAAAAVTRPSTPVDPGSSPFRLRGRPRMACDQAVC